MIGRGMGGGGGDGGEVLIWERWRLGVQTCMVKRMMYSKYIQQKVDLRLVLLHIVIAPSAAAFGYRRASSPFAIASVHQANAVRQARRPLLAADLRPVWRIASKAGQSGLKGFEVKKCRQDLSIHIYNHQSPELFDSSLAVYY